jgi:hypothetical protein
VCANARINTVFIGTASNKLYRVKFDGTAATSVFASTIFIDLFRWWQVGKIVIEFAAPLATGDDLAVTGKSDINASDTTFGSATFAAHGAIMTKELYKSVAARKLQLKLTFGGGTVRIRRIEVWGDPIERPTHTRS